MIAYHMVIEKSSFLQQIKNDAGEAALAVGMEAGVRRAGRYIEEVVVPRKFRPGNAARYQHAPRTAEYIQRKQNLLIEGRIPVRMGDGRFIYRSGTTEFREPRHDLVFTGDLRRAYLRAKGRFAHGNGTVGYSFRPTIPHPVKANVIRDLGYTTPQERGWMTRYVNETIMRHLRRFG